MVKDEEGALRLHDASKPVGERWPIIQGNSKYSTSTQIKIQF